MSKRLERQLNVSGAYRRVFETLDGEVVLKDMVRRGFVNKTTFVAGDPFRTAWNEGMRSMVIGVLRTAKINQDKLLEVLTKELQQMDL